MDIKQLIQAGHMSEARTHLIQMVKSRPADQGARILLAKVLCFLGEWDKADRHLDIIATQDATSAPGIALYKGLIQADHARTAVFSGQAPPSVLPKAPDYLSDYTALLNCLNNGDPSGAAEASARIASRRPPVAGTRNEAPFAGFRDTDDRLCGFLEAFVHERYVWIPMESLRELVVFPPESLMDLLWASCRITLLDGLTLNCYLPVLYPDSASHEEEPVRMGRVTDWAGIGPDLVRGFGQHIYEIGTEEIPLLELGDMLFHGAETPEPEKEAE